MSLRLAILVIMCLFAGVCFGQSVQKGLKAASLCSLNQMVAAGTHRTVRVSGIFSLGMDLGTLQDATCPKEITWIELDLQSKRNKEKLRRLLDRSGRAYVVFDGEFYGPPMPDPKLPEAIKKSYQPGWGHLAAFRTKLVVYTIRRVSAVPPKRTVIGTAKGSAKQSSYVLTT